MRPCIEDRKWAAEEGGPGDHPGVSTLGWGGDFGQGSGEARGGLSAGEEGQARSGLDGMVGGREAREEAGLSIQPGELEACTGQGRWGRIRGDRAESG